jgi:UDPglucose 6-dehydrogenase
MKYNVGIIGRGFVGGALANYLSKQDSVSVSSYDLSDTVEMNRGYEKVVAKSDIIYVCVPTPADGTGECFTGHVWIACKLINYYAERASKIPIVMLKSTVAPSTTKKLQEKFKHCIMVCNPEFLTERTAIEDVEKTSKHLLGIPDSSIMHILSSYHEKAWPNSKCVYTDPTTAEMIKTTTNSFFATKVTFANMLYDICNSLDIDYDNMIGVMQEADSRVGEVHWQVPGHDGKRGFGGKCLPKELSSMISIAEQNEISCRPLEAVEDYNELARNLIPEEKACQQDLITEVSQLLKKTFTLPQS